MVKKIIIPVTGYWLLVSSVFAVSQDRFVRIAILRDAASLSLRIKGGLRFGI